jgi:hypothetical protein
LRRPKGKIHYLKIGVTMKRKRRLLRWLMAPLIIPVILFIPSFGMAGEGQ